VKEVKIVLGFEPEGPTKKNWARVELDKAIKNYWVESDYSILHGGEVIQVIELATRGIIKFRMLDSLHAKIYAGDTHAILGSSNFSKNGTSLQREANIRVKNEMDTAGNSQYDNIRLIADNYYQLGRDYLSRLIYGARISLLIGAVAATISGLIGTSLGLAAGYFGGRVDMVVTFIITTRLAMPVVLVALAVVALAGGSLQVVILVLGLLLWDRFAVVTRATTMQVRALDYVAAARATGCSTLRIVLSEILPNIMNALANLAGSPLLGPFLIFGKKHVLDLFSSMISVETSS